jgi:hypothetical protein
MAAPPAKSKSRSGNPLAQMGCALVALFGLVTGVIFAVLVFLGGLGRPHPDTADFGQRGDGRCSYRDCASMAAGTETFRALTGDSSSRGAKIALHVTDLSYPLCGSHGKAARTSNWPDNPWVVLKALKYLGIAIFLAFAGSGLLLVGLSARSARKPG